jgi:CheY-like chemotaxis protein
VSWRACSGARAVVWVVDDLPANHALVRRSLPEGFESVCELVAFASAAEAFLQIEVGLDGDSTRLPDVIFMDFFIGDAYGNELTRKIRAAFGARRLMGPYIVGHSSSPPASLEIVRAGADVAIEKDRHAPVSPGVRRILPDLAALRDYAGRARRPLA